MIRRHFLAFVLALTALTTGCGGVEADQTAPPTAPGQEESRAPDESADPQRGALYTTCESFQGHRCSEGSWAFCYFSNGAVGSCECMGPIGNWACQPEPL
jgi:hypothetical protein